MGKFLDFFQRIFRRKKCDQKKEDRLTDFVEVLVERFFKKGIIVYTSGEIKDYGRKPRKVTLKAFFLNAIPPNVSSVLIGARIVLTVEDRELNFSILGLRILGNIAYLELGTEDSLRGIKNFFHPTEINIINTKGTVIYSSSRS